MDGIKVTKEKKKFHDEISVHKTHILDVVEFFKLLQHFAPTYTSSRYRLSRFTRKQSRQVSLCLVGGTLSQGKWSGARARARARGIYLAETVAITSFP